MEESILKSISDYCGVEYTDDTFDNELLINTNGFLVRLFQIGYGSAPFQITGTTETWADLIKNDSDLTTIKTWLCGKVKLAFDPPTSATLMEALKNLVAEMEFAIEVTVDNPASENVLHPSANATE